MWLTSSALFWSSLAVVGYTYAGYPMLIFGLSKLAARRVKAGEIEPPVSIVLAAHNEQARIGDKIENLLALDYPRAKLEVIIVSDGSTDGTDEIVARYADRGVVLERLAEASGKPSALNRGVARATGDLIVFCDARQTVDRHAVRALVRPFADSAVGAASGELHIQGTEGPGVYWKYEKLIRAAEGAFDSVVGATGALFAIRRELFRPIPPNCLLDDVFTPMQIALRGHRVLFEPGAKVFDAEPSTSGEFSRKARTLAGNFQILHQLPALLDPRKNRLFPQFVSHKLMRLACPFALLGLLGSNAVLVCTFAPGWPFYAATLAGQVGVYGLALKAALSPDRAGKVSRVCHTFVVLNAAAVEGLRRYLRRDFEWTHAGSEYEAAAQQ